MNGASPPALTAAVSNADGLGSCAAALLSRILEDVRKIRAMTDKPFNVNLSILGEPNPDPADIAQAQTRLAPFHAALDLPPPSTSLWKKCARMRAPCRAIRSRTR